jgi:hypothetical protein
MACLALAGADAPTGKAPTKPASAVGPPTAYTLSGPFTHGNLTVYLILGKDQLAKKYLTLQEALEQKKVIVHETRAVNELAIENLSTSEELLVQAGDIVKGGQQDRVLALDLVVPPKSGRIPINAFCVEAGRWHRRGTEKASAFDESKNQVPTNSLKLAVRQQNSQAAVWENVAKTQGALGKNMMLSPAATPWRRARSRCVPPPHLPASN